MQLVQYAFGGSVKLSAVYGGANGIKQAVGDLLAQLDTPLIEGIDVPNHGLYEYLVFVQGDQRPERLGREFIQQNQGAGLVALIALPGSGVGLVNGGIAQRQNACLRQTVGDCQAVLRLQSITLIAVAPCRQ